MILVEQNLDFIAALSQRVLIIQKGTITREVRPDELPIRGLVGEFIGIANSAVTAATTQASEEPNG